MAEAPAEPGLRRRPLARPRRPAPYDDLRRALLGDTGRIRDTILERATQTNEVGRLATLVPAFASLPGDGPVGLLEVGASAGLCLYPDRWSYAWSTDHGTVTAGSAASNLRADLSGPAPLPEDSSPALRRLLSATTLQDGWQTADLMDRREVVRLLLDVTIKRAAVRGRNFDPRRVEVRPSELLLGRDNGSASSS